MRWLPLLLLACAPLPEDGADTGSPFDDDLPVVEGDTDPLPGDDDTGGLGADDTGETDTGGDTGAGEPCTDYEVHVIGPDAPVIGDTWRLTMVCDGAVTTGPYVIRVSPVDLARIASNAITFSRDGSGQVMVQTGSIRRYVDVVVGVR
jgi:hypothetical protein